MSDNNFDNDVDVNVTEPDDIVAQTTIADVYRADKQLSGIVKKTRLI